MNQKPKEREIYIWNILGSMANAIFSVLILMIVTRSLDKEQTDLFSISWSISQLMLIIGTFQIRTYQATDIKGKYKFHQYLRLRIITIVIMLICSVIYVAFKGYDPYKAIVVFIMCVLRAVEALSDVYGGWFQQKERLDLAGKAITYRVIISMIAFGGSLLLRRDLVVSSVVLLICYIGSFVFCDLRYSKVVEGICYTGRTNSKSKWILEMFVEGAPIFLNAFLAMSISNCPKMAIDSLIEQGMMSEGVQTIFNIIFMPASFINLAYIVFRPMITKMAIAWNQGNKRGLIIILLKIQGCLLVVGTLIVAGSAFLGVPLLSTFYGINLTNNRNALLIIIVGGCFYTFASVFDNALVAMRKQYGLILSYIVTWVYMQIIVNPMVKNLKIMGASLAYATSMFLFFVVTMLLFAISFLKAKKSKHE